MLNYASTFKSIAVDPNNRSEHLGISITRSGVAELDEYFQTDANLADATSTTVDVSKFLVCETLGDIVFQYPDYTYGIITNATPGFWYPIAAVRVVTGYTFNSPSLGAQTTTATGIYWYGGV